MVIRFLIFGDLIKFGTQEVQPFFEEHKKEKCNNVTDRGEIFKNGTE